MNYTHYFEQIGLTMPVSASVDDLARLQLAHLSRFPFQSLSTVLHYPISMELDDIDRKMVTEELGGYCFEHHILTMDILKHIGFEVRPLTGYIIHDNQPQLIKARTHMLLLVTIDQQPYLFDVGYGGLVPTAPLKLVIDVVQDTPHGQYKITAFGDTLIMQTLIKNQWQMLYGFDLQLRNHADLEMANWFVSTYPQSPFRKMLMASRIEPNGIRHNLMNLRYRRYEISQPTVTTNFDNVDALLNMLKSVFHIDTDKLVNQENINNLESVLNKSLQNN